MTIAIQRNFDPEAAAHTVTAAAALKKMNEIIAFRLAVHELMPPELRLLRISQYCRLSAACDVNLISRSSLDDGKAYFKYINLFECALTVGPVDPQKQWCLADIKFLHIARQSVKGKKGLQHLSLVSCRDP
jgi:hypothetical protein